MSKQDAELNKSSRDLAKTLEVERILGAFKLNPYDILDVPYTATDEVVKKTFRKKSLLIHPDKFQHERGPEAFDLLKKAESHLSDPIQRREIDGIIKHARTQVVKMLVPVGFEKITDDDLRLQNIAPTLDVRIRQKTKEILLEEEQNKQRKQTVQMANEGAEKARYEAEVAARKRKAEEQVKWEATKDAR